ncbi:MAG: HD domain-containing protein [Bacilli bacterium]|nr:HD domain-containing protein [Bacilli bacterium]
MITLENTNLQMKAEKVEGYALHTIERDKTLSSLFQNMKNKDNEVYQHSLNVCRISIILGLCYNFNLDELITLAIGSLLHDIGKLYLDKDVLYKPDRLTDNERLFIEAHTSLGYKVMRDIDINPVVLEIIKSHHEKLNGKGYPEGLYTAQINILIQIVTIADIYDALTSERVYKGAYTQKKAFEIMEQDDGLNQVILGILKELIYRYK